MTGCTPSPDVDPGESPFVVSQQLTSAWERHRSRLFENAREVSEWLVDQIDPQPGDTVLELGAGPGETGFLAAERIGPSGRLISTDLGPGMVEAARRGARAGGLTNVEFHVMDAQELKLADDSVDGVICRFAVMLMPCADRALSEARRVLRRGRRLAYAVWGAPDRNPWLTALAAALHRTGHLPLGDPIAPGGVFSLSEPRRNRELLTAAGFSDIRVQEISGMIRYEGLDDYWSLQSEVAGALSLLVSSLPAAEVTVVRQNLESILVPYGSGGVYSLPSTAVAVTAA